MKYLILIPFFIFLTLKLAGLGIVATWSWWVVFSPLLFALLVYAAIFAFAVKEVAKREKLKAQIKATGKSGWALKLEEMQNKKRA
jgi:hypothetical protein